MQFKKVIRKISDRSVTHFLLPTVDVHSYYAFLELKSFKQMNPFRKLSHDLSNDFSPILNKSLKGSANSC
jgi:hypothetical protein